MKVNLKKKVLESASLFDECHLVIRTLEDRGQILEVLELCQNLAMSIVDTIEKHEPQIDIVKRISVRFEEYCKNIFYLSCVEQMHSATFFRLLEICNVNINKVKQKIVSDIPEEKQVVVFLPYMASMWDSLESICREAMKNDDWETYVMPVPYYSFNKQRKPISDTYEYEQFPKDLPLIDYRECSLKDLKPDLIFYHNPYDDFNLITCVHPEFFSRNLKEITSHLVYVPYYFAGERTMEHMLDMPGVKNAWRIVVQPEVAKQYLEKYSEEKVLPLGSPKLDSLFNAKTANIPEEWKRKIEGKTVFFFNTHLTSVMIEPNKFFDMLDYIMELMFKNQGIVVLWRPHPLMQQTLKSFQDSSELLIKYKEKIEEFNLLSNGIYDDTSDLNRSIMISDGYIGSEKSSVIRLYKETGKPVYIIPDEFERNWEISKSLYSAKGLTVSEDYVWFFNSNYNAISKFNLKTKQVTYVTTLEKFDFFDRALFFVMGKSKNWLVLLPLTKRYVVFFNIVTNEIKYVEIETEDFSTHQFMTAKVTEDSVAVFRCNFKDYYYIIEMETFVCRKEKNIEKYEYIGVFDGCVFLYEKDTSTLKLIDEKNDSIYFNLPKGLLFEDIPFIKKEDDSLWVVNNQDGLLIYWEKMHETNNMKLIDLFKVAGIKTKCLIRSCFATNKKLLFSFTFSDSLYSYDMKKNACSTVKKGICKSIAPYSRDVIEYEDKIILFPLMMAEGGLTVLNKNHTEVCNLPYSVENMEKLDCAIKKGFFNNNANCVVNGLPISPDKWFELVKNKSISETNVYKSQIGKIVWENIEKTINLL